MPEQKIGRWRASYLLTAESFEFLRKDKEMLFLPVLSFFAGLLVLIVVVALFFGATAALPQGFFDTRSGNILSYAFVFLGYIGFAYVFMYFQGALATMVHMRLAGQDPKLGDGLANSRRHAGKILKWSLLSATVGIIFRIIADKLGWAGKLFGVIGAIAWSVLTFFMVPVVLLEDRGMKDSISRSGQLFRETWGETLVMNFSLNLFIGALDVFWIILCGVAAVFAVNAGQLGLAILIAVVFLTVFIVLCVVGSVLSGIFKTVLYEYAASGRVPASFTPGLIMGAIKSKNPHAAPAAVPTAPAQPYGDTHT